ncbi:hypothetical protein MMC19_005321 [Ptychographa xylographoides]|nr:hypothetical protein [Ptychographa xylographoides]
MSAHVQRPKIVLGAGSVGDASDPGARYTTAEETQAFLNLFRKYGHTDIDTARGYSPGAPGTSEPLLAQTDFKEWAVMDTKIRAMIPNALTREKVAEGMRGSLEALGMQKVHIEYLHGPDRDTPIEETCEAIDKEYRAGRFEKFGLSNFSPEEVEKCVEVCEKNGWVKPSVYQGHYNAISRLSEDKLLPVLRKHGIAYYAYSPSGAGFFSGNVNKDSVNRRGGRWDSSMRIGQMYGKIYLKDELLEASKQIQDEAQQAGISGHAVALRWVLHHSALKAEHGDAIIVGASSLPQLEENLKICDAGPLPKHLAKAVDEVWPTAKPFAPFAHM